MSVCLELLKGATDTNSRGFRAQLRDYPSLPANIWPLIRPLKYSALRPKAFEGSKRLASIQDLIYRYIIQHIWVYYSCLGCNLIKLTEAQQMYEFKYVSYNVNSNVPISE